MSPLLADLGLLYCAAVWGATFFMVKDALAGVDPVAMVAIRFLLSALLLAPWALTRPNRGKYLKESFLLAVLLLLLYVTQTVGLGYTSASNSGFITGLFVLFVPVFLLAFFGKPPTPVQWGSTALALAGLWCLTGGVTTMNFGDAITLVSAATYAGHLLATDKYVRGDSDPLLLAFHQFWMTGLMSAVLTVALGRSFTVGTTYAAGTIVFLAVVPTLSAFFIQMHAQKVVAPIKVSLIFSLEPVFAALFAWTIGGEGFVPEKAAGGALIVAAMMAGELSNLSLLSGRKKEILPLMSERVYSSKLTFFMKVLFPGVWFVTCGVLTFSAWTCNAMPDPTTVWKVTAVWVLGSAYLIWYCRRLKSVRQVGDTLYVSDFSKEIAIPASQVAGATEARWDKNRIITLRLKSPSEFGDTIVFMPAMSWTSSPFSAHPVLTDLKSNLHL